MSRYLVPLIVLAVPVQAQQAAPWLPDVQVTATRIATPLSHTAAAVTVLTGDELRARGITTLLDALGDVPGAATVQSGSYGAVASLFLRGGENDFTKVLLDGVPMNLSGGQLNLANIPLDDVERIEVVRGPVSVLYGADAMSGVIQIFTRRGAGRWEGEASTGRGTWGNADLRGRVAGRVGAWRAGVAAARFASTGTYSFNNAYLNGSGSVVLGWQGGPGSDVAVTAHYSDALARFPTDGGGDPTDINQRVNDREGTAGVTARHLLPGIGAVTADAWLHRLDSRLRDPQDSPADTTGFGFAATRHAVVDRRGGGLRLDRPIGGATVLTFGAGAEWEREAQRSRTLSDFGFGRDESIGDFDEARSTVHGAMQLLATPRENVDVQAGVRHDHNSAFGGFTTWRVGVVWRPTVHWRVWSSAGSGFKAPTFSELFAASAFERGNPELRPERSRSYEGGAGWQDRRFSATLTVFHQEFEDLVQYVAAIPGDPTYGNLGAARTRGVELGGEVRAGSGIRLRAHTTRLFTAVTDTGAAASVTFQEGEPLLRRPEWAAGVSAIVERAGGAATLAWRWVGERHDVDFRDFPARRTTLPSYGLVDLSVAVPILRTGGERATAWGFVRGENLLDATWDQIVGFPGRGRTLVGGVRVTW